VVPALDERVRLLAGLRHDSPQFRRAESLAQNSNTF
jgi:hypothetical protein